MREELPKFTIKLDKEYVLEYENELKISEETINEDLGTQASYHAYYSALLAMAKDALRQGKLDLKCFRASLYEQYRNSMASSGERITDTRLNSLIDMNEEYLEVERAVSKMEFDVDILDSIVRSFFHRKDMVFSLAANLRSQQNTISSLRRE